MRWLLTAALVAGVVRAEAAFPAGSAAAEDEQIEAAVRSGLIPGAVLLIGHDGAAVYRKAYGSRAIIPAREEMTPDTVFDAASLTKVIATTSSIMKLFDEGKIRIADPVSNYLPDFEGGKSQITIRELMTHFSGMRPDLDLEPKWSGYETGIAKALMEQPVHKPGTRFVYSDINFILLGEVVHRMSGQTLSEYAAKHVFKPLGMQHTRFLPPADWVGKIAPTEIDPASGMPIRGVVHDDTARYMGGVAGHAGMFTTADDLGRFAQMMIDEGVCEGKRVFGAETIRLFTSPQTPPRQPVLRGLGWDINSPFSANRGELFPIGSYGHTGFTGVSMWIDPFSKTYVILLTNFVHPHRGKSLSSLRGRVATIAAGAFGITPARVGLTGYQDLISGPGLAREAARNGHTLTGLDVLASQQFAPLRGKRVGLITNQTGISRDGKRNIDLMAAAGVKVVRIFSPEHGLEGKEDQLKVTDARDAATGVPVVSLYNGATRRLAPGMLSGVDALVYDIQDVGARFYTYSCTLLSSLEESAKTKTPFYVLDRPNPITGVHVEGPVLDQDLESFTGCYPMPVRHGLTFGELATMANAERHWGGELHVVAMQDWQRADWFDSTSLRWIPPSPNMRSLNAATLYPGIAMIEGAKNLSVGRGTDTPFEQIGAEWIDGARLAQELNAQFVPGIRVYPTEFTPAGSNVKGRAVRGVRFVVTDRDTFDACRFGLELGHALEKLFPGKLDWDANRFLIGNHAALDVLRSGQSIDGLLHSIETADNAWAERRKPYLLYQ